MDGFKRPTAAMPTPPSPDPPVAAVPPPPVLGAPADLPDMPPIPDIADSAIPPRQPRKRRWIKWVLLAIVIGLLIVAGAAAGWYYQLLKPINPADTSLVSFQVKSGDTTSAVSRNLQAAGLIQNRYAFEIYARLNNISLQASTCRLSATQSTPDIAKKLQAGCHEFKVVTFYPGATIEKPLYKPEGATLDQTMYAKYRLQQAGYSDSEITAALAKTYTGPLFADKPAGTSLEGYIFGETYYLGANATAQEALQTTFDLMYNVVQSDGLVQKFKAQGLNLYQGITMASIVQRELNCEGKPTEERKQKCYGYEQTIAQVFLSRYHQGMMLGSDVTFIYAADMMGVTPRVDLESPYNTRIHTGLPPGPIASPGELALKAVANPSNTDYLYFIAGDDGLIYFAKTLEEHEANIKNHCQQLCNSL